MAKKLTDYQISQIKSMRKTCTVGETAKSLRLSMDTVRKIAPGLRKSGPGRVRKFTPNGRPLEVIKEGYFDTNVIDWIV